MSTTPIITEQRLFAVTLRRPWAALVALGLCPVISLPPADEYLFGEYVAIHASAEEDSRAAERLALARAVVPEHELAQVTDAVVAVARARRLESISPSLAPALSPWAHGSVLLWVDTPVPITPVPTRGGRSMWTPPEELRVRLGRAYRDARAEQKALARAAQWNEELEAQLSRVLTVDAPGRARGPAPFIHTALHSVLPAQRVQRLVPCAYCGRLWSGGGPGSFHSYRLPSAKCEEPGWPRCSHGIPHFVDCRWTVPVPPPCCRVSAMEGA
ncbi:hypothetical protein D187_008749 [Cystobacter fuscus DSM 2262]|uniref:Uncharacterized protein n=1 Tax=Cystobacter fuscus (strain ATCC 25194 / DSM 2262 / NBRC 100088 / M29) TaxID=1242864 RepID=S9PHN5_CYSF2|nr:hypothetical protein [Cystobacter fuscus]EPX62561.1 hypothetical protein D187_008749 [Cystobacter fuscus DSM 2262]